VRRAVHSRCGGHPGNANRSGEAAEIEDVGLDDVEGAMLDHPAEASKAAVLLAARHRQRQRVGDLLRFVVEIEGDGFFEEGELLLVHQPADSKCHRHVVRAVGVGVNRHTGAERLASERNQRQIARRRRVVVSHPRPEPEFDGFGADFADQLLQVLDLRPGAVATIAAGPVDGDVAFDDGTEQLADRLAGDRPEQIEDGNLDAGHRHPEGQPLPLVVRARDIELGEQRLEIAGVLLHEEGSHLFRQDRRRELEDVGMPDTHPDRAIGRARADEELVAGFDQVDRLDTHRRFQELATQHRRGHQPREILGAGFGSLRGFQS
jgi:hypothetical protein